MTVFTVNNITSQNKNSKITTIYHSLQTNSVYL